MIAVRSGDQRPGENEYVQRGQGCGEEYIEILVEIAVEVDLDVPYFTVTGWGNSPSPHPGELPIPIEARRRYHQERPPPACSVRITADDDYASLRMALRTDGRIRLVFVNNHVRHYPQQDHRDVRMKVVFPDRSETLPSEPITIGEGEFFLRPVNVPLGGRIVLSWVTAEPLAMFHADGCATFVFFAARGEDRVEYVFSTDFGIHSLTRRDTRVTLRIPDGAGSVRAES